ncbi:MAG: hypothetical protein KDB37_04120 [Ilumatobacter sp.]|nr:hypothetical protein [Ilumatobacter sp.]
MATKVSSGGSSTAVLGLEHGRERARRQSSRRRRSSGIKSGFMFVIVAGTVGAAGYFGYQFFRDEQAKETPSDSTLFSGTPHEVIDHLEDQARWNGPGAPAFGVGDEADEPSSP